MYAIRSYYVLKVMTSEITDTNTNEVQLIFMANAKLCSHAASCSAVVSASTTPAKVSIARRRSTRSGQWPALAQACRPVKEALLGPAAPEALPVTLLGRGSALIGQSQSSRLTVKEVAQLLLEGFFPLA